MTVFPKSRLVLLGFALGFLALAKYGRSQQLQVLHAFETGPGGTARQELVQGSDGYLYGVTGGGDFGFGAVFRITTNGTYTVIHSFDSTNGARAMGALIQGIDGRLYGSTTSGGTDGAGTVFALQPDGSNFAVLHSFTGSATEGGNLEAGVIQGQDGRLYGATRNGGASGRGTLFALGCDGSGFTILHSLTADVMRQLTQGPDGRLYGTTGAPGNVGYSVFSLNPDGSDFATLFEFYGLNYGFPWAAVMFGNDGKLYSANNAGGCVYKLNTNGTGFTVLKPFPQVSHMMGLLATGDDNKVYGTIGLTFDGGPGGIFSLNSDGSSFSMLYSFGSDVNDGANPFAGMIKGKDGRFYGVTDLWGSYGHGTIYALTILPVPTLHFQLGSPVPWIQSDFNISWPSSKDYVFESNQDLSSTNWTQVDANSISSVGTNSMAYGNFPSAQPDGGTNGAPPSIYFRLRHK